MKKSYIPPKSKLYALKLNENIADSLSANEDEIVGTFIISFTQYVDPCRGVYTATETAVNTLGPNATFEAYFNEIKTYGGSGLWNCLRMA